MSVWAIPIAHAAADSMVLQLDNKQVMMNGQPMHLEVAPQLDGNTTMVPLRFIGEGMGAKVGWNQAHQQSP